MNTEHTPGPWTLHKHEAYQISYIVRGGEKQNQIAQCFNWQDRGFDVKSEANARLIAAAPDLLKALRIIAGGGVDQFAWNLTKAELIARAAIAKAEGKA